MPRKLFSIIGVLFFGIYVYSQQPQFSVRALFGPNWYAIGDDENYQSKQDFNYSVGGKLLFNIPASRGTISLVTGYFYDTKNYTLNTTNDKLYYKTQERTFTYGNVPLLFEVRFNINEKLYPFLSSGVIFGWVLTSEQQYVSNDGTVGEGFASRTCIQEKQTDFHISTGVNLRLTRLLLLHFEFFMGQQVNEGSSCNVDSFGRFSYGIKTGIQFDIYLPEKWLE